MDLIQFVSLLLIQVMVYSIGTYVLFHEKIHNIGIGIILLLSVTLIYYVFGSKDDVILISSICAIIVLGIFINGSMTHKFLTLAKSVFIISCSESLVEAIINLVTTLYHKQTISDDIKMFLANIILINVWLLIGKIEAKKINIHRKYINLSMTMGMGVMAIALVLVIATVQYAEPFVNSKKFSLVSGILMVLSYFGIVFWGKFILNIKETNDNYKCLLETEYLLRVSQKNNYELMLAKEEETKAFRHDLSNHVMCLKEIIESGNTDKAHNYIEQMQMSIIDIQKKTFVTSNEIIDAILNYHIHVLDENVDVMVSGICDNDLIIGSVELCSVIANPLQNAIEAINQQQQGHRFLKIRLKSTRDNFFYEICNSFDSFEVKLKNGLPITKKQDKEKHGIGLKNVSKIVEKNNGIFKIDISEDIFKVTIILPLQ